MKTIILSLGLFATSSAFANDTEQTTQATEPCNLQVIAKSDSAVGDPCMTQKQFVASLNLNKRSKQRLTHYLNNPQMVGLRTPESERTTTTVGR